MSEADFDANWYLQKYPDVREAVERGSLTSAWAHFDKHGRDEGRSGKPTDEDRVWVLAEEEIKEQFAEQSGANFLSPRVLNVSGLKPRRVLLTGSCLAADLQFHIRNRDDVPV